MIEKIALPYYKDLALIYGAMVLSVAGQLCLKQGVTVTSIKPEVLTVIRALFTPYIFTGFALYAVSSIVWLFALSKFPLSVAYPAAAISYICIIGFSAVFFHEPITQFKVLGAIFILIGIYFIFKS